MLDKSSLLLPFCRSHLAQASIARAGATAASQLGQVIAGVPLYTWLFCGMIVLSRVAFWVYDMVDAQIFQTVRLNAYNIAALNSC